MGVYVTSKTVTPLNLVCNGRVQITLALQARPSLAGTPLDIVLLLDRSGSMADALPELKLAAIQFVNVIRGASPDPNDPTLIQNTRIGIVSFSDNATVDLGLSNSVPALVSAINGLVSGGFTNHADAFNTGVTTLNTGSNTQKVLVLFTDGASTRPLPNPTQDATAAAAIARNTAAIYAIGLRGNGVPDLDTDALESWVTPPANTHLAIADNAQELQEIFDNLATGLTNAFAQNIEVVDTINPDFTIVPNSIVQVQPAGTTSTTTIGPAGTLTWRLDKLGDDQPESASVTFEAIHTGLTGGTKQVNTSITYKDDETPLNTMLFNTAPLVTVNCGPSFSEPCPIPVSISASTCDEIVDAPLGDLYLMQSGNLLQISLTLKSVCPNRPVALGIYLTKKRASSSTYDPYAFRAFTIPGFSSTSGMCQDIPVDCLKFVLPPDANIAACDVRYLKVYVFAHYIGVDPICCLSQTV